MKTPYENPKHHPCTGLYLEDGWHETVNQHEFWQGGFRLAWITSWGFRFVTWFENSQIKPCQSMFDSLQAAKLNIERRFN